MKNDNLLLSMRRSSSEIDSFALKLIESLSLRLEKLIVIYVSFERYNFITGYLIQRFQFFWRLPHHLLSDSLDFDTLFGASYSNILFLNKHSLSWSIISFRLLKGFKIYRLLLFLCVNLLLERFLTRSIFNDAS